MVLPWCESLMLILAKKVAVIAGLRSKVEFFIFGIVKTKGNAVMSYLDIVFHRHKFVY